MSNEGKSLAAVALIDELFEKYDVSMSVHKEKKYYVVMIIWKDDLASYHSSGNGETLFDAINGVYDEIKQRYGS